MADKPITSYEFFQQLSKLPFVDEIVLYGSRARGTHRPRSDIDLAITCPRATEKEWLHIIDIIDEADTLLPIDCVRFDTLRETNPLRSNILRDKKVLFLRTEQKN